MGIGSHGPSSWSAVTKEGPGKIAEALAGKGLCLGYDSLTILQGYQEIAADAAHSVRGSASLGEAGGIDPGDVLTSAAHF